jgi:hypothetical protein
VFSGCGNLTSIVVASGNPNYDSRNNCNAIIETATNTLIAGCMNTVIPNSVASIGEGVFSGCTGLTSIDIPNSVTSIGSYAFYDCSNLTSVTIGKSVTSIGNYAFKRCLNLTEIYSFALVPPTLFSVSFGSHFFSTLHVYDIALEAYEADPYWSNFANIIGMPSTFEVDGTK